MIDVVMAREDIPPGLSVFLAGPSAERGDQSWRPAAISELEQQWPGARQLHVLSPESRGGVRAEHYEDQFRWELAARHQATAVLFWIPRDVTKMPGFTTNVEFGHDIGRGRLLVLGCPPDCPNPERNRYLIALANAAGAPVRTTLRETVSTAITMVLRAND